MNCVYKLISYFVGSKNDLIDGENMKKVKYFIVRNS